MLGKVFVNIKTVLQNKCTQCLYWLNFFFWAYMQLASGFMQPAAAGRRRNKSICPLSFWRENVNSALEWG